MRALLSNESVEWLKSQRISVHNRGGIRLIEGEWLQFSRDLFLEPYTEFNVGHTLCSMGFMSFTNSHVPEQLSVGRYSSLAPGLRLAGYRHPLEHVSTNVFTHDPYTSLTKMFIEDNSRSYNNFYHSPQKPFPTIGNDVWIGANVALSNGISIGTGSIIASDSVVTRSVGPYQIVGGNPAQLIRTRFSQDIVDALIDSQWWKYKFTDFDGINVSNPEIFLRDFENIKHQLTPYNPGVINLQDMPCLELHD